MRKQSGRWACFFEQMGDQSVHLFEGEARVMNTPPICSKKQATRVAGQRSVCALAQRSLGRRCDHLRPKQAVAQRAFSRSCDRLRPKYPFAKLPKAAAVTNLELNAQSQRYKSKHQNNKPAGQRKLRVELRL